MNLAEKILDDLEKDPRSFTRGNTNGCMVNSMIACRYLGLDWEGWFKDRWEMTPRIGEHQHRIEPYLEGWFKDGDEEALGFLV